MKDKIILVLYSTDFEISSFREFIFSKEEKNNISDLKSIFKFEKIGVGQTFAASYTFKFLEKYKPDLVLNIGIAGAFKESKLEIGDIVLVQDDIIENGKDIGNLIQQYEFDKDKYFIRNSFIKANERIFFPSTYKFQLDFTQLKKVTSLTVSLVSSNNSLANKRHEAYNAEIETMEGGSISFVLKEFFPKIPYYQIRAISNFTGVEKIQKDNLLLSIKNLNNFLKKSILNDK